MEPIKGMLAAIVTPFAESGDVDLGVFAELVNAYLDAGLHGVWVAGNTGEVDVLNAEERTALFETAVKSAAGRGIVAAHVGAPATRDAVTLTKHAEAAGVSAVAAMPPTTQSLDSIKEYYEVISRATSLPMFAYHVAGRAALPLYLSAMSQLVDLPNLAGIKFSDPNLPEMDALLRRLKPRPNLLFGVDAMLSTALLMGADGGIGGSYNAMPGYYAELYQRCVRGDWASAAELQREGNQVMDVLKAFGGHAAIKAVVQECGFPVGACRSPGPQLKGSHQDLVESLKAAGYFDLPGSLSSILG